MMKKELQIDDIYININDFQNPIDQETFEPLPKIYSTIRDRVERHKIKFAKAMEKRLKIKREEKSWQRGLRTKKSSKQMVSLVSLSKQEQTSSKFIRLSLSKSKLNKEAEREGKFKEQSKQGQELQRNKNDNTDHQHQSKAKFNILRLQPVINYSASKHGGKPETLAQLTEGKLTKSTIPNNPLVNLYKRSQKLVSNRYQEQSHEQHPRDSSESKRYYIPKQLLRNMKFREQRQGLSSSFQKGFRSQVKGLSSPKRNAGSVTEFSRRIADQRFSQMIKIIPIGQNKKFKLPTQDEYDYFLNNYQPMDLKFSLRSIRGKPTFKIVPGPKSLYLGEHNSEMHGQGILLTPDSVFEGQFQHNQRLRGCQLNYDGFYTGHYCNDMRDGKGRFEWNNGQVYQGDWKAGRRHGFGIWRNENGDSYEGQWVNGRQQGQGTLKEKNNIYKGELLNGYKHGKGEEYFSNGDHYQGAYSRGKAHGFGRYAWKDGSYYQGEFVEGYREGEGELHEKRATYRVKALSGEILSMGWGNRFWNREGGLPASLKTENWSRRLAYGSDLTCNQHYQLYQLKVKIDNLSKMQSFIRIRDLYKFFNYHLHYQITSKLLSSSKHSISLIRYLG